VPYCDVLKAVPPLACLLYRCPLFPVVPERYGGVLELGNGNVIIFNVHLHRCAILYNRLIKNGRMQEYRINHVKEEIPAFNFNHGRFMQRRIRLVLPPVKFTEPDALMSQETCTQVISSIGRGDW